MDFRGPTIYCEDGSEQRINGARFEYVGCNVVISRQATINIGTIGHVAHGKFTVVRAISGVQTVCFKNELERNINIKLGYANAKIYKCEDERCPRPVCYKAYGSGKECK